MVIGRISKFYSEIVLLEQIWVIDGETKVFTAIKNFETNKGCSFEIKDFKYFILGEGIELGKKDFATEVAEQMNG
jgi:elongation factor Ts